MYKWVLLFVFYLNVAVADSDIKFLTIGPGNDFWSVFGHSALVVDDEVYGFGYFSFEDENLISSFVNNQMYYDMGVSEFRRELEYAQWQNRSFTIHHLAFTKQQKQEIKRFLEWHRLPENISYRYDYFSNNCATKIRDILDDAWQGVLKSEFSYLTGESYYSATFPAQNQSLMNFGMVLGYGWSAYQQRTAWELMAFPEYFNQFMDELSGQKVSTKQVLFEAKNEAGLVSKIKTHWFALVFPVLLLLGLLSSYTRGFTGKLIEIIQITLGIIILYFWLFSAHDITKQNFNILLFSPLVFLLYLNLKSQYLLYASYVFWLLIATYLQAWYFLPMCLLHIYWLYQRNRRITD